MSENAPIHHLAELAVPDEKSASDAAPSWALLGMEQIEKADSGELLGHTDLVDPAARLLISYADQKTKRKVYLLAVAGPAPIDGPLGSTGRPVVSATAGSDDRRTAADLLGYGLLFLPTSDNLHLAELYVQVRREHRAAGIGTELWQALSALAGQHDRTSMLTWSEHPVVDDDTDALVPPTGFGRIRQDRSTRFAERHGFRLEQAERHSQLELPIDPIRLAGWRTDAATAAGSDYLVRCWQGATPDDLIEPMVELHRRMSIDVPIGDLDIEEENWDADRVRHYDAQIRKAREITLWAVAEYQPTGELAAYTELKVPQNGGAAFAYQEDTLVHGDHRGRRLGLLVKAANLQQLATEHPAVRRLHTWNAGENSYMLAINVLLGFRPASYEAVWQLRTDQHS
jgi:GNAT superfamily N-acetyltransferase